MIDEPCKHSSLQNPYKCDLCKATEERDLYKKALEKILMNGGQFAHLIAERAMKPSQPEKEERCIDCGKLLDQNQAWIKYGRCHSCHFESDKTIPERVRSRIQTAAIKIDLHHRAGHDGLSLSEHCMECLIGAWIAFCEAREIMGMGDTWTRSRYSIHGSDQR